MQTRAVTTGESERRLTWFAAFICLLIFALGADARDSDAGRKLERLTEERQLLTAELDQYRTTLEMLSSGDELPEESPNSAIRKLAAEAMALKQKLVAITEQEVTLLQAQITAEREDANVLEAVALAEQNAIESKPLRIRTIHATPSQEAENVTRLHKLLENYYAELQESARILPTAEEMAMREMAQRDIEMLEKIPYSPDKVRLNGAEGSTALADITRRLMDPTIPESRRDIALICTIKTRLFETLVGSESRSLQPVGKNHFIARIRLQPGNSTLGIMSDRWEVRLPPHTVARDFLFTLYRPPKGSPELHVFAVDDLLAADNPHIPAWLPEEIQIRTRKG